MIQYCIRYGSRQKEGAYLQMKTEPLESGQIDCGPDSKIHWTTKQKTAHRFPSKKEAKQAGAKSGLKAWRIVKLGNRHETYFGIATFHSVYNVGDIIVPSEFAEHFQLDEKYAKTLLIKGLSHGFLEPVYRLHLSTKEHRTEFGHPDWTSDIPSLNKVFIAKDGTRYEGGHPGNIEIAFRRTLKERL